MHLQVCSPSRTSSTSTTAATTKEHIKEILWINFFGIGRKVKGSVAEIKTLESSKGIFTRLKVGIDPGVSKLIVQFSLFIV